uniref:Chitin-binding type-2 domain-containing protein n=1 Tax=Arion vulgaris TaxID=1028688 RepID=A0A0B6Z4X1_9EUPU
MESLFGQFIVCVVLASGAFSQNVPPPSFSPVRGGGGGIAPNFNCPEENGEFEVPGDCTRYYRCDRRVATLFVCRDQLIYNSQLRYCDWPHNVPNANCQGLVSPLNAETSQVCRNNPGNPNEAFISAHPQLCNAFYTCSTSYNYAPCSFCGEGMYFSPEARGCVDYRSSGVDIEVLCRNQNKQFVQHADKVLRQMDSCWPYASAPNPYLSLLESIRSGVRPTQGPSRQG